MSMRASRTVSAQSRIASRMRRAFAIQARLLQP
jgi:hypothetical protein